MSEKKKMMTFEFMMRGQKRSSEHFPKVCFTLYYPQDEIPHEIQTPLFAFFLTLSQCKKQMGGTTPESLLRMLN